MALYASYVTVMMKPKLFDKCWKWMKSEEIPENRNIFNRIEGYVQQTEKGNILFSARVRGSDNDNSLLTLLRFVNEDDEESEDFKIVVLHRTGISTFGTLDDVSVQYSTTIQATGKARRFTTTGELIQNKDNPDYISDVVYDANKTPIHIRGDRKKGFFELSIKTTKFGESLADENGEMKLTFEFWGGVGKLGRLIDSFMDPDKFKNDEEEEEE